MKSIEEKYLELKSKSGTHSPSIQTILGVIPELKIEVDACFLSNPYATELFLSYLKRELLDTGEINRILEFYPSQSFEIAKLLSKHVGVNEDRIFITNGAIEAMQAVIHNYVENKIIVNIPTFSSYYEFTRRDTEVVYYSLQKENNFSLNINDYLKFVKAEQPDTIVLINPNNPDGGYIKHVDLIRIIESLPEIKNIIIDESFIHFAYEDSELELKSIVPYLENYHNVIVIKSMSKDFGIAGLRCGYGIFPKGWVKDLTTNGFLWNLNGLAEYFFRLYVRKDFNEKYEVVRKKYITESLFFISELQRVKGVKVYPSRANFVLIEITSGKTAVEVATELLVKYGVYVRNCEDKIGLNGEFIRVAARSKDENEIIIKSIDEVVNS
ncbi:histidinol-phosphate aminotransferase family protein [Tenacibaculum singaporense]|uniref:Histidinol-phosphate aminotransferase family protein n=1 Tax=Tenacibaculum singaporense TaxID=2358479 RepID=A0A3Q8RPX5_9FLAO|nr:histidinol-phosphate transaminase [Tenacibaculum singaporense]AZJ35029.1 histidinol-phosphate aminotransferase family protein [Tenacibaculum singaporense]